MNRRGSRDAFQKPGATPQVRSVARRGQNFGRDLRGVEPRNGREDVAGARHATEGEGQQAKSSQEAIAAPGYRGSREGMWPHGSEPCWPSDFTSTAPCDP